MTQQILKCYRVRDNRRRQPPDHRATVKKQQCGHQSKVKNFILVPSMLRHGTNWDDSHAPYKRLKDGMSQEWQKMMMGEVLDKCGDNAADG